MIDERTEEQASLYALGLLSEQEAREFERELRESEELRGFVAQLKRSADLLATSAPSVEPPPHLKQKLLDQIEQRMKIVPLKKAETLFAPAWFPWAMAACLAVLCAIFFSENKSARQRSARLRDELQELQKQTISLRGETDILQNQVAEFRSKDRLSQLRIAMLSSLLASSPKAVAVSVWDNEQQKGVLVVEHLASLPSDKDYQLWVIDSKYPSPVDAGVFTVDEKGAVRFQFQPKSRVNFEKIAVTLERKGGVAKPEGKMVLLGS